VQKNFKSREALTGLRLKCTAGLMNLILQPLDAGRFPTARLCLNDGE
jgi:hypothetical protein